MRVENKRMQAFLKQHDIEATPKYISTGSLRGTWRLYNLKQLWNMELAQQLNELGFVDFNGRPLAQFSGNGGFFAVFVRGHKELLTA